MSTPLSRLEGDWLDALALVKDKLSRLQLVGVITQTTLEIGSTTAGRLYEPTGADSIRINERILDCYRAERIEMLLSITVARLNSLDLIDATQEPESLAAWLGCTLRNVFSPRERWRLINIRQTYAETPAFIAAGAEWTRCHICYGPVPSDSQRADYHDECTNYVKVVLVPALKAAKAQREAAEEQRRLAQINAEEMDK